MSIKEKGVIHLDGYWDGAPLAEVNFTGSAQARISYPAMMTSGLPPGITPLCISRHEAIEQAIREVFSGRPKWLQTQFEYWLSLRCDGFEEASQNRHAWETVYDINRAFFRIMALGVGRAR